MKKIDFNFSDHFVSVDIQFAGSGEVTELF